ncbi:hypothetical protein QN219_31885 [Sinorhizobium sp. 7-81]|uniref:hypothetical protein n=1 Tax=Sinorhizobium sp. 8-89 TaxID=3049089 RepID=UPI0024C2E9D0|nr:hypothetical protein [Sinorhizobium sp. 8-89]MDK1494529.1 hypothetical protein [Sinorhizobium sp. 8-89]
MNIDRLGLSPCFLRARFWHAILHVNLLRKAPPAAYSGFVSTVLTSTVVPSAPRFVHYSQDNDGAPSKLGDYFWYSLGMLGTHHYKLKIYKGRYRTWLERANDLDCLTLIWAVQALQSSHEKFARKFITYPKEAVTEKMIGEFAIYKWELETIVTSLLTTPKDRPRLGKYRYTNLTQFSSLSSLVHYLRDIENIEYAKTGTADNIWEEMYRIGQRQFSWQRGYNCEQLYRYAYVYGQGECAEFFEEQNGLSVSIFLWLSLALFALTMEKPWIIAPDVSILKMGQDNMEKTLALHSIELTDARSKAKALIDDAVTKLRAPLRTAYMPSLLRQRSMLKNTGRVTTYCAPLPPLVMNRATAGLYYDIKQGPDRLLTEANTRFEEYIRKLVEAYHPRFAALKGEPYGSSKATEVDPPDCLVKDGEEITIAVECKATKLTFEGQFAENPTIAAKQGLEQLAKGIFQLWRFFSHVRRGIYTTHTVSPTAHGIVLTMDSWMQMATKLREGALERAKELAAADPEIKDEDRRMVVFASVQELNDTFAQTETDNFMTVLGHAVSEKYRGYGLPKLARECGVQLVRKGFPLNVAEILPWWEQI